MHIKLPIEARGTRPTRPTTCTTSESNNNHNNNSSQVSVKMLGSQSCKLNNKEREGRVGEGERKRDQDEATLMKILVMCLGFCSVYPRASLS